jgi:hypothetical protein
VKALLAPWKRGAFILLSIGKNEYEDGL